MKTLIICEKPSLAKTVSHAINQLESCLFKGGYSESEHYIVVPAFGHLFGLKGINDYTGESKWVLENLPFKPVKFEFKLKDNDGISKQFNLIKTLIHENRVTKIANCGDSDREGEIIIRLILDNAKNTKPVVRLWLPDQTEQTILSQIKKMPFASQYDNLANEGYARTYMDWLYGINLTRYATIKSGTLLKVGRVITPIVKVIYDRDAEIQNFQKQKYYMLESKETTNGVSVKLTSSIKKNRAEELETILKDFNIAQAIVKDIDVKKKVVRSPKLFSQSTLQNALSKKYKYSPTQTLSIVQSLYEKGLVSYPRTPTEYLATAEKLKVEQIIKSIIQQKNVLIKMKDNKNIFDDSKIESHSAIIPTSQFPNENLNDEEKKVYTEISNRFCSVFYAEECIEEVTTINISHKEDFSVKGVVSIQKGFKEIEEVVTNQAETKLPKVQKGDVINTNFKIIEKITEPKKHYTVTTLNNFLKNPFKKDNLTEEEEYKLLFAGVEIGTEATRAGIIDNAIKGELISLEKDNYKITEKGKFYINTLDELGIHITKETSVELNKILKLVYKNEKDIDYSINKTFNVVKVPILENKEVTKTFKTEETREILGECPKCKNVSIVETPKTYNCTNKECDFKIWKEIAHKKMSRTQVKKLLKKGLTDKIKGFKTKAGKVFDAKLELNKEFTIKFKFD